MCREMALSVAGYLHSVSQAAQGSAGASENLRVRRFGLLAFLVGVVAEAYRCCFVRAYRVTRSLLGCVVSRCASLVCWPLPFDCLDAPHRAGDFLQRQAQRVRRGK